MQTFKRSNDSAFAEKVEDVVGLYAGRSAICLTTATRSARRRSVSLKRSEAEVDAPERYGGLRGKIGLFVLPAALAERTRALAAMSEIKAGLVDLKWVFDAAVVLETERERTRCAAIHIPIPGPGNRTACLPSKLEMRHRRIDALPR